MYQHANMLLGLIVVLQFSQFRADKDFKLFFAPTENRVTYSTKPNVTFATYYNDHMVLQKAPKRSMVWGYTDSADVGHTLHVTLNANDGSFTSTHASVVQAEAGGTRGVWSVQLAARPAGGPYNVTASVRNTSITLTDVLFGDVWLCSGQSNMVFEVSQLYTENVQREYNMSSNYPDIRLFLVGTKTSDTPMADLDPASISLQWSKPTPKTLRRYSAVCWLFGRHLHDALDVPIGLITSAVGGTPDESWSSPDALRKCGVDGAHYYPINPKTSQVRNKFSQQSYDPPKLGNIIANSVLWNAMIHPFLNMTIFGTIWYQGEEDADLNKTNYYCTFPAMIEDWRSKFHTGSKHQTSDKFPFGFVMLGPGDAPSPGNKTRGYPSIRWQQTAKYGYIPNTHMHYTFMAVATDLSDFHGPYGGVHYRDKETVGSRLALAGLSKAYGFHVLHEGPLPTEISIKKSRQLKITYDNTKKDIYVRNTWGFELCCVDDDEECDYDTYGTPWVDARIVGHGATHVTISMANCTSELTAIRYIWRLSPCEYKQCAVYGVDNELPAPPVYIHKKKLTMQANGSYLINW